MVSKTLLLHPHLLINLFVCLLVLGHRFHFLRLFIGGLLTFDLFLILLFSPIFQIDFDPSLGFGFVLFLELLKLLTR